MNAVMQQRYPHADLQHSSRHPLDDLKQALASAHAITDQPPPPSLREILTAYRTKGDGDRDMLLAMLNSKTAEDQRISSIASLQRTMIELYQQTNSPEFLAPPRSGGLGSYSNSSSYPPNYPPSYTSDQRPSRHSVNGHRPPSRGPSPPRAHLPPLASKDVGLPHQEQHPRKRHRTSRSPHATQHRIYEPNHPTEQFPPSPYSSSDRSESADYSPRSRASMNIGSLLSSNTRRDVTANGDAGQQERE